MSEAILLKALVCLWSELTTDELAIVHRHGMNAVDRNVQSKIVQAVQDELARRRKVDERKHALFLNAPQWAESFSADELQRIQPMAKAEIDFCCQRLRDQLEAEDGQGTCSVTLWIVRKEDGLDVEIPDDPYNAEYPDSLVWVWKIGTYYPDGIPNDSIIDPRVDLPKLVYEEKLAAMMFAWL